MNRLVVIVVAILVSLVPVAANAAKCKWQVDTVSYSSGDPVRWTRWVRNRTILTKPYAALAGVSEGGQKYLGLQVIGVRQTLTTRPTKEDLDALFRIPAGSTLSILLADNSTFELISTEDVIGDADVLVEDDIFADDGPKAKGASGYAIEAFAILKFPLSDEAIAALTAQDAREMRLHADGREYEFSFGKKPVGKVKDAIACVQ